MSALRIFLSHSHKDNNWCSVFVEELKRCGADVWYDKQGLYVGAKWRETIETELTGRDIFLIVLTPDSWASSWVQDEITLAMSHQKRVVGVLHQSAQISGFITTRQMLDVIGLSGVEAARSVAAALGLARSEQSPASTVAQSADGAYEYFEIVARPFGRHFYRYQINNSDTRQALPTGPGNLSGPPDEHDPATQEQITQLRGIAKANGLEELPEKGAEWYSYRFRRKKP
ncbi:MAG TPA: toll/interleukin-1 receptor domain-containing protein [Ktedonobacterales bacterium]|nr:toll/interleukin-1 receptor domain-containing protein [Ktedonobacterales bacterium]